MLGLRTDFLTERIVHALSNLRVTLSGTRYRRKTLCVCRLVESKRHVSILCYIIYVVLSNMFPS